MILIILLVVLIFGFLVFVHELGHFVAAKRSGVTVEEFGFGFPPRLIGKKVGGTIYSINALPLGGFVRMKGEDLDDTTSDSFGAASFRSKTIILLAGVTMNALTAYFILVGLCLTGLPPVIANQYSHGTVHYAQPKAVMAIEVVPGSPAASAGLVRGDLILSGDGTALNSEKDLLNFTKGHAGQTVNLQVRHHDQTRSVQARLRDPGSTKGFLGITPFLTYKQSYSVVDSFITAGGILGQLVVGTVAAFGGLFAGLFVHGKVSDQVAGPVGITVMLSNIVAIGWAYVWIFVASISVSLAVVNIMPLPALDGGRYLLVIIKRVTKKALSPRTESVVHLAGFAALMLLMVVITVSDISHLNR